MELYGKSLLIVDDDDTMRRILRQALAKEGCQIFEAANGNDAFDLVTQQDVDCVISDIRMPGGDGLDLLRAIKSYNYDIPVFLISGFTDLSAARARELGAEDLLSKPFTRDDLVNSVRRSVLMTEGAAA